MEGFIPWEKAQRISYEIDEAAGARIYTVRKLVQAGIWTKLDGGFLVVAMASSGLNHGPSIQAPRLGDENPFRRHFLSSLRHLP
jgi:hypothetical protein